MSKRQVDFTVADIIRLKPKWFMAKQSDATKAETHLHYIHSLMEQGQSHIAEASFSDVFDGFHISDLSKTDINQRIMEFSYAEPAPINPSSNSPRYTRFALLSKDALREAVKPSTRSIEQDITEAEQYIRQEEQYIQTYEREIRSYRAAMQEKLEAIREYEERIELLHQKLENGSGAVYDKEKLAILKGIPTDTWMVVDANINQFTVIRIKPLTMKYINAAAGMCKTLYMGFMGFTFNYSLDCLGSFNVADYINYSSSRIHPHVSGSNICWGNVSRRADVLAENKDAKGFFELLESILTTYCPDNPYVAFHSFERARTRKYVALSGNLPEGKNGWFSIHRTAILNMLRMNGSKALQKHIDGYYGASTFSSVAKEKDSKRRAFMDTQMQKLGEKAEAITRDISIIGQPVSGKVLETLLKKHGIIVLPRNILAANGINAMFDSRTNIAYIRLMIAVHGPLPVAKATPEEPDTFFYGNREYTKIEVAKVGSSYAGSGLPTYRLTRPNNSSSLLGEYSINRYSTEELKEVNLEVKPLDKALNFLQQSGLAVMSAPVPVPADEDWSGGNNEDCAHDDVSSDGYCLDCEAYCAAYDETLDVDEEEAEDAVPF